MPANRFFSDNFFIVNMELTLAAEESRHLLKIMRHKLGDVVELVNGRGQLAQASITKADKRNCLLSIDSVEEKKQASHTMVIAQGIPRINRLDCIIEKCTELGMDKLYLFPSTGSEKKELSAQQKKRCQSLAIAAMKQCGRLFLPEIEFRDSLQDCIDGQALMFFGDIRPHSLPLKNHLDDASDDRDIIFFIGPEKGFSDGEHQQLEDMGAIAVKLHDNILRTDTAPLVAMSIIKHHLL